MDSRQFGVLMMAALLVILAPIGNVQAGTETNSTTTGKPQVSAAPAQNATSMQSTITHDGNSVISSTESHSSASSEEAAKTTLSSTGSSTVPSLIPTTTFPAVTTTVSASSVTTTMSPVTNDHAIRDVTSDVEKCSASFKATLEKEKDFWVPEKAFLTVSGEESTLTIEQFCEHLKSVTRLNNLCNNATIATDAEDVKIAPIVAGLASMFTSLCSGPKTQLNLTVGDSTPCAEFLRVTAKSCSSNPLTRGIHVYPTQVLFEDMTRDNCTVVFNTKDCISKAFENNDKCSPAQRVLFRDVMNLMIKGLPCVLLHSADATAPALVTDGPIIPPKIPGNAGVNFQANFFTTLPVLLLAFKFY